MLGGVRGEVRFKEPMSFHTGLRIGGPADIFVIPSDLADLQRTLTFAARDELPVTVLGGGHSVLVKDRRVPGVVIRLGGCFDRVKFRGEEAIVGAGMSLPVLIREAAAVSLGGLEHLVGVPASVGGALTTGASTEGGALADVVSVVYFVHPDGTLGEMKPGLDGFHGSACPVETDAIVVGARLALGHRPQREVQRMIARRMCQRKAATPLALASAGYLWHDPPGRSASSLIAGAGLRGKRFGMVEIAAKDPNFIINRGAACAADVIAAMDFVRARVEQRFGVTLEPRIRIVGE